MREQLAALAVAVPFVLGAAAAPADDGRVVFRFRDPAIVESSGLAVVDGRFVTVNDSGDRGRVFTVDPATGRTVGVTTYDRDPQDVEALAPAGDGEVWVGDIGDNGAQRATITVTRVPVGPGERRVAGRSFELGYPGAAADAETLLAEPGTGRLLVATKDVFGGVLYAAPRRLDPERVNRLHRVGEVVGIATDGTFLPDGRHLVVRDYERAVFYRWPRLTEVGDVRVPVQPQGEAIAADEDGTLFVSSEGARTPVYRVDLPTDLAARVLPPAAQPAEPSPTPPATRAGRELPESTDVERSPWPWFLTGWLGVGVLVALLFAMRRR